MNKNAIKKFAIDARNKLIASVTDKAGMLGITPDNCSEAITKGADFEVYKTAAGTEVTLNKKQCEQRRKLVDQIHARGFEAVVEEVAYTWFNRICAIRFMEVNDYMYPVRVRVLSSEKEGKNEPDVVTMAPDIDWDFTDKEREEIIDAKMNNRLDDLFRMLFIKQCNLLHEVLPGLFEETEDYTEMLLNISFTNEDDVIRMLALPENNLFIVGDDDQSIYRFRGARPEIMLGFSKDYPNAKSIILDVNYRSTKAVVSAARRVIERNKNRYQKEIITVNEQGDNVHIQEVRHPVEESHYVREQIAKAVAAGTEPSQIAVLYRTNTEPRALVETFMEYHIPFQMKEHLPNLYEHFIGRDFQAYMRMALGGRDRGDFLMIMNRPNRYIGRDSVDRGEISFENLRKYYMEKDWMVDRIDQLEVDLKVISRMTPYAAIQYIRKSVGYDLFLNEYAIKRKMKLEDLQELIREMEERAKEFKTIEEWFAHIEKYTEELRLQAVTRTENRNAVSLMTFHAAKGLEYDTVFIIGANEDVTPYKKAELPEEMEEERRMFYVAMTRAKKHLTISYVREKNGKAMEQSRFLGELFQNRATR